MHTILKKSKEFDVAQKNIQQQNELISASMTAFTPPKKPNVLIGQILEIEQTQRKSQGEPRWTHEMLENDVQYQELIRQYKKEIQFLDTIYRHITSHQSVMNKKLFSGSILIS